MVFAAVVPTRNRASLAIQAIQSILAERDCDVRTLVSDNSTDPGEIDLLARFCAMQNDERLVYVRPPRPMPMGTHWDWAIREALRVFDATHVTVHYDRKVTRPGELALLCRVAARHPDLVITFGWDAVVRYDDPRGHQIIRPLTDGRLYEVSSARVLATLASGQVRDLPHAIPLLNNCVVPREVLMRITGRFGGICDSLGADVSFMFRFLGMYERYLYLSTGLGVLHSFDRSHAAGFLTGKGGELADLRALWGDRPWLDAAPIPGINLGQNMLFHEYVLAQRVFGLERFPAIDMDGYLRELGRALAFVADPAARQELRATLERHGWSAHADRRWTLRRIAKSIRYRSGRLWRRLAMALGIRPGRIHGVLFASEADALQSAMTMRRRRVRKCALMRRLDAREVALE